MVRAKPKTNMKQKPKASFTNRLKTQLAHARRNGEAMVCEKHGEGTKVEFTRERCPLCESVRDWELIAESSFRIGTAVCKLALSGIPFSLATNDSRFGSIVGGCANFIGVEVANLKKKLLEEKSPIAQVKQSPLIV